MPGMRVHELAKEFNMSSKEMLDLLAEMNIPAKTHATPLKEESVEEVRKKLSPEIKQRAGELDDAEAAELAKKQAEEEAKKQAEEAKRRAAVEAERKLREEERARRDGALEDEEAAAEKMEHTPSKQAPKVSAFQSLADQIEAERARVEREKAEAEARARAEAAAAEVAKKRRVEENLRNREQRHSSAKATAE